MHHEGPETGLVLDSFTELCNARLCSALVLLCLEIFVLGVTSEPDKERYKDGG